jgi:hypothetical protein
VLIACRGNLTTAQETLTRKYPLMVHRDLWMDVAERTLRLLHDRYTETPRAIVRGKSQAQLDAESDDA